MYLLPTSASTLATAGPAPHTTSARQSAASTTHRLAEALFFRHTGRLPLCTWCHAASHPGTSSTQLRIRRAWAAPGRGHRCRAAVARHWHCHWPGRQSAERKRELGLSYSAGARTRPARARPLAPRTAARRRPSTADGGLALRGLALREHGRLSAVAPKAFFMHKNGFVDESFDNMAPVALIAQLSFSLSVLRRISKPRVSGFKLDSLAWPS